MPPVEKRVKQAQATFRVLKIEGEYVNHRFNGPMLVQQWLTLDGDFTIVDEDGNTIKAKCDDLRITLKNPDNA